LQVLREEELSFVQRFGALRHLSCFVEYSRLTNLFSETCKNEDIEEEKEVKSSLEDNRSLEINRVMASTDPMGQRCRRNHRHPLISTIFFAGICPAGLTTRN